MKPLMSTVLSLALLSSAAFAQTPSAPASGVAVGPPQTRTDGGDKQQPDPHIYRLGEHVSPLYGEFDVVADWQQHKLKAPKENQHWVRYEDNFLLVNITDGLITEIIKAS